MRIPRQRLKEVTHLKCAGGTGEQKPVGKPGSGKMLILVREKQKIPFAWVENILGQQHLTTNHPS